MIQDPTNPPLNIGQGPLDLSQPQPPGFQMNVADPTKNAYFQPQQMSLIPKAPLDTSNVADPSKNIYFQPQALDIKQVMDNSQLDPTVAHIMKLKHVDMTTAEKLVEHTIYNAPPDQRAVMLQQGLKDKALAPAANVALTHLKDSGVPYHGNVLAAVLATIAGAASGDKTSGAALGVSLYDRSKPGNQAILQQQQANDLLKAQQQHAALTAGGEMADPNSQTSKMYVSRLHEALVAAGVPKIADAFNNMSETAAKQLFASMSPNIKKLVIDPVALQKVQNAAVASGEKNIVDTNNATSKAKTASAAMLSAEAAWLKATSAQATLDASNHMKALKQQQSLSGVKRYNDQTAKNLVTFESGTGLGSRSYLVNSMNDFNTGKQEFIAFLAKAKDPTNKAAYAWVHGLPRLANGLITSDEFRNLVMPEALQAAVQKMHQGAIKSVKSLVGGRPAAELVKIITGFSYNPSLSPDHNMRTLQSEITYGKRKLREMDATVRYFKTHKGNMMGYVPLNSTRPFTGDTRQTANGWQVWGIDNKGKPGWVTNPNIAHPVRSEMSPMQQRTNFPEGALLNQGGLTFKMVNGNMVQQ